jgi:hypothetical protein
MMRVAAALIGASLEGLSDHPVFLQQNETNFVPGLRKAGIQEK